VSFRRLLTLFFVIIVIVPMIGIALLLYKQISSSADRQVNVGIETNQRVGLKLFEQERRRARAALNDVVVKDPVFIDSMQRKDLRRARKRAGQLVASPSRGIERIVVLDGKRIVVDAGGPKAIAPVTRPVRIRGAGSLGDFQVSVTDADTYAAQVKRLTGLDSVIRRGNQLLTTTIPGAGRTTLPDDGSKIRLAKEDYVVRSATVPDFRRRTVRISTLAAPGGAAANIRKNVLIAGGILLGFMLAAIACAVLVSKFLQRQIRGLLMAARRLGQGDFGAEAPAAGKDEFADLGREFNKMSRQLEARIEDVKAERRRAEGAMRRLGEAVASNLDRDALLRLVVSTAVDGVPADAGRVSVSMRGPGRADLQELSRVGNMNGLESAVQSAESEALSTGSRRETTLGEASAIAYPLRPRDGDVGVVGVVSIGRTGRPFTSEDRDLFSYLASQAGVSMENVGLHEAVTRESVTDELTGLSNRRGFDDALTLEVERARRFGTTLGLVLLDLDNFKLINDTYGHQQGDVVLREVARVVRETAREIDYPARYGGEEMGVLLPETDIDGAFRFAERLRERIAELSIRRQDSSEALRVTTSCGVAAIAPLPADEAGQVAARTQIAADEAGLVAAADAALYEAKRAGKNKSVRAR